MKKKTCCDIRWTNKVNGAIPNVFTITDIFQGVCRGESSKGQATYFNPLFGQKGPQFGRVPVYCERTERDADLFLSLPEGDKIIGDAGNSKSWGLFEDILLI